MIEALAIIDEDLTQIKQAHQWILYCASEDAEIAQYSLAFAGIDGRMLRIRLSSAERIQWFNTALTVARQIEDEGAVIVNLYRLSNLMVDAGKYEEGAAYLQESLTLAQQTHSKRDEAKAWIGLGGIAYHRGNQDEAEHCYQAGIEILKEMGSERELLGVGYRGLASIYSARGDHQRSLEALVPIVALFRETKDLFQLCNALNNLGSEHNSLGNYEDALDALDEGQRVAKQIGDNDTLGYILANLGLTNLYLGQPERAQQPLQESVTLLQAEGNIHAVIAISGFLYYASMTADNLEASYHQLRDLLAQASKSKMIGNVLALIIVFARWYALSNQSERCVELLNLAAPRPELDSEWSWFVDDIRKRLSTAYPGLNMDRAASQSLEAIVAEILTTER